MITLAHLSDLHFGAHDPAIVQALTLELLELRPELVVISGDLTQRARKSQFVQARGFIAGLEKAGIRTLVVPGNHDISLWNWARRIFRPFARFHAILRRASESAVHGPGFTAVGINSVARFRVQEGHVSKRSLRRADLALGNASKHSYRIATLHHPPERLLGAKRLGRWLHEQRIDILLSGHGHRFSARGIVSDVLWVQAGTATSRRLRGESNAWNILQLSSDHISVQARRWEGPKLGFVADPPSRVARVT